MVLMSTINAIIRLTSSLKRPGCRPRAPVAEGGPVGLSDGGNRRDWFPGGSGAEGGFRPHRIVTLFSAFKLVFEGENVIWTNSWTSYPKNKVCPP